LTIGSLSLSALLSIPFAAIAPATAADPHIQTVRIVTAPSGPTSVVLQADGILPTPEVGVVDGPPRIYMDFSGVLPLTEGVRAEGDPWIRRVRVALHSPRVTRVVIDLFRPTPHQIVPSASPSDRLAISVGSLTEPRPPPRVTAVPRPAESYGKQLTGLLERLEKLRPVLSAIDARAEQPGVSLQVAVDELRSIERALTALHPPGAMTAVRDRLLQSCTLALQAVRGRIESAASGNALVGWNAASAAAGALMLLDRTRADLKASSPERKPGS